MPKKLSLRGLARALGYSVATLSEHRNAGIFSSLPDGSYDLETVKRRLLQSTNPNAKHRVRLASKIAVNRTPDVGISSEYVRPVLDYDDDSDEHIKLSPEEEAGVQAAMKHLRDDKFRRALNILCPLPTKMATAMSKIDTKVDGQKAIAYFENLIVDNLRHVFSLTRKAARDE